MAERWFGKPQTEIRDRPLSFAVLVSMRGNSFKELEDLSRGFENQGAKPTGFRRARKGIEARLVIPARPVFQNFFVRVVVPT
jgi:hypothetical protein